MPPPPPPPEIPPPPTEPPILGEEETTGAAASTATGTQARVGVRCDVTERIGEWGEGGGLDAARGDFVTRKEMIATVVRVL
jgi:hypothetical protein